MSRSCARSCAGRTVTPAAMAEAREEAKMGKERDAAPVRWSPPSARLTAATAGIGQERLLPTLGCLGRMRKERGLHGALPPSRATCHESASCPPMRNINRR